jgi:queuine tRNA-ribosyltransferase
MPVGTAATIKAARAEEVSAMGYAIMLSNTYHLVLRPGLEVIARAGGLHRFMNWKANILTDSGGFQVFSLSRSRKITEEGVAFNSHIDGSRAIFTPESVVDAQTVFGSDVMMQLDVCSPWGVSEEDAEEALAVTGRWAARSKAAWEERGRPGALFGIVQGGFSKKLREKAVAELAALDLPGYALGGLSVGEPFEVFSELTAFSAPLLPAGKPRYLMGIGTPDYILEAVRAGIDLFDCVFPTRTARNGLLFSSSGYVSIKREEHKLDQGPIDPECRCATCASYSRSYLRHLYKSGEILYSMLATHHNLRFLADFVDSIRVSIVEGRFMEFYAYWIDRFRKAAQP